MQEETEELNLRIQQVGFFGSFLQFHQLCRSQEVLSSIRKRDWAQAMSH